MRLIDNRLFREMRRLTSNVAIGWKLTRTDGYILGFTSYDVAFVYDGLTYYPTNAFSGTAITARNNLSVDNMNAVVLSSDNITENDLRGGKWDNALVEVFWINPREVAWGVVPLRGGQIGEIKLMNGRFEVELRSLTQKLQQPFGRQYTLECGYTLGDSLCHVEMEPAVWDNATVYYARVAGEARVGSVVKPSVYNGFWYMATAGNTNENISWGTSKQYGTTGAFLHSITGAPAFVEGAVQEVNVTQPVTKGTSGGTEPAWPTSLGATIVDGGVTWTAIYARKTEGTVDIAFARNAFTDASLPHPSGFFKYGSVTWLTGANAGLSIEVRDQLSLGRVDLLEAMPNVIEPGDTFELTQGCDKTRTKCKASVTSGSFGFDNLHNFGGFPDMPTEDKVLQTPNAPDSVPEDTSSSGKDWWPF